MDRSADCAAAYSSSRKRRQQSGPFVRAFVCFETAAKRGTPA
jgi:hypothetical protein